MILTELNMIAILGIIVHKVSINKLNVFLELIKISLVNQLAKAVMKIITAIIMIRMQQIWLE